VSRALKVSKKGAAYEGVVEQMAVLKTEESCPGERPPPSSPKGVNVLQEYTAEQTRVHTHPHLVAQSHQTCTHMHTRTYMNTHARTHTDRP